MQPLEASTMFKATNDLLLDVDELSVGVNVAGREIGVLSNVSFNVGKGEIVGVVGESGCGKSLTALAIIGLLGDNVRITGGTITLDGERISSLSSTQMRKIRGSRIGMIFQEPMVALNPLMRVGRQVKEVLVIHAIGNRKSRKARVLELFRQVGLPDPKLRYRQFPHQLSGGMRQRVMIAMALAAEPKLLIADEPTTALDVTVQAQILDLLEDIRTRLGTSVVLVTHDMGVVSEVADRVVVMYAGQVVESAPVAELFENARHPYSVGLLGSVFGSNFEESSDELPTISGRVPSIGEVPSGCPFEPRCENAIDVCRSDRPPAASVGTNHIVACWSPVELPRMRLFGKGVESS